MVCLWSTYGLLMVYLWSTCGLRMIYLRPACDLPLARPFESPRIDQSTPRGASSFASTHLPPPLQRFEKRWST